MTRTLAITQNMSLDGSVEFLDDWFDPQAGFEDPEFMAEQHRQDAAADALLLGRQTFEDFRGFWPHLEEDPTGIGAYLDAVEKYVVSSTLADADRGWDRTTVLRGDVVAEVAALKEAEGRDIVCTGSLTLVPTLVEAGLVDEYRFWIHPAVQGRGRRPFPDGWASTDLRLRDARRFDNGVALVTCVAG